MSVELARHYEPIFQCPRCAGHLRAADDHMCCAQCSAEFGWNDGYLDLAPDLRLPTTAGLGPLLLQDPLQVARYEDLTRPAFLQVAAANWAPEVTAEDERHYLHEHANPAPGPILDVACGAGCWTRVFVEEFGADRIIGLDLSAAMLHAIGRALPTILRLRASAMRLPFADNTLGAANCWAALQLMPDPAMVLNEIGRCLRPRGTFTLATLTPAPRPVQRYFQRRQEENFNTTSFDPLRISGWLDRAGLEIADQWTPACFLFLTARKRA